MAIGSSEETKHSASFEMFWPQYLRAHAKPATRITHYAATAAAALSMIAGVATGDAWSLSGLAASFALTLSGHAFIEKNPQTLFAYPLWSILGCLRLTFSALTGHIGEDLENAGLSLKSKQR